MLSFHASFPDDQDLCLKEYESRTIDFRPVDLSKPNIVFLPHIHPDEPLTSASLARWIKGCLQMQYNMDYTKDMRRDLTMLSRHVFPSMVPFIFVCCSFLLLGRSQNETT